MTGPLGDPRGWASRAYAGCNGWPQGYRVFFAVWLLAVYLPRHLWIGGLPDTFFVPPPSLAYLTSGFPPEAFFVAVNLVAVAAALLLVAGRHVRTASVTLTVVLVLGNTWGYSAGKIDHDILLVATPLVLAGFWTGDGDREAPGSSSWPLALLALIVALGLSTAALAKASTGWLDPSTQAVYSKIVHNHVVVGRETVLSGLLGRLDAPALWEMLDVLTVALEGAFILAFVRPAFFRVALAAACLFHAGIFLAMDIGYTSNIVVYGAFVDWSALGDRPFVRRSLTRMEGAGDVLARPAVLLACVAAIGAAYTTVGNPVTLASESLGYGKLPKAVLMGVATVLAGGYLALRSARAWMPTGRTNE